MQPSVVKFHTVYSKMARVIRETLLDLHHPGLYVQSVAIFLFLRYIF